MTVKITSIVENTVYSKSLWAEEGLALLVEVLDQNDTLRILYDCGRSGIVAVHNLQALGVPVGLIDYLVLSHGHEGHLGGLLQLVEAIGQCTIILHPQIFAQKYKKDFGVVSARGRPPVPLELSSARICSASAPIKIGKSVIVSGEIPRSSLEQSTPAGRYYVGVGETTQEDEFAEELALGIRTSDGIAVVTACAHRGLMSTVSHVLSIFDDLRLQAVVGGYHLNDSEERTASVIGSLIPFDPKLICPCHCTGLLSIGMLREAFPGRCRHLTTGQTITLG